MKTIKETTKKTTKKEINILTLLSEFGRNIAYSDTGKTITLTLPVEDYERIRNIINEYKEMKGL